MKNVIGLVLVLFSLIIISCKGNKDKRIVIDFSSPTQDSTIISFHEDEAVHVAIASISSPRESYRYYNELLDYISTKIKIPIHTIQKQTYSEVNQLLLDGAVDFAFISTGAYISIDQEQIDLLVAPVIDGKHHYHAYLITQKNNPVKSFRELKGSKFAFSDPLSHTGFNYPLYRLQAMGEDPQSFFSKFVFSYGHDLSIEMVNREMVDASYVHGIIYDFMVRNSQEKVMNTRVVEVSEPFGIPSIVCPVTLDKHRFDLYQKIFLELHNEIRGREILDKLNIDRYEIVNDKIYDNIRKIKNSIGDEAY